jgi:hypothetical protein
VTDSDFLGLWDRQLASFCVEELMPAGEEAALLVPLAACPGAARLVRHAGASEDHRQRKAAAILAGFLREPPAGLLDELFEHESERAAAAAPETSEPLYSQSVAEDVVLAAARWCREPARREEAFGLLRKVVTRTLIGEYWSAASYALATLCRYRASGVEELLASFEAFARSTPPDHPLRPTLATEREFARGLWAGLPSTVDAAEVALERCEQAGLHVEFEEGTARLVATFLQAARRPG